MLRNAVLATVGCGLIACANGAETTSKTSTTQSSPSMSAGAASPVGTSTAGRVAAGTVVATWKGGKLTYGDLVAENRAEFRKFRNKQRTEAVNFERQQLEGFVVQSLVQAAAKAAGKSEQEYVQSQVPEPEVSEEEAKKFYDSNPRLKSQQQYDQVKDRIRSFLGQQKRQQGLIAFFEQLKKDNNVQFSLPKPEVERVSFDLAGRPTKGKADAKVTIVEFSDFECPYCSKAVAGVEELLKAYPDDVKVVFMHFPLTQIHPRAKPAAIASQCANQQGKFWAFHDAAFANQRELTDEKLGAHAKAAGLDMAKYSKCIADPKTAEFVDKDMAQGNAAGVEGTPSFFINGEPHQGIPTPDAIKPYLQG